MANEERQRFTISVVEDPNTVISGRQLINRGNAPLRVAAWFVNKIGKHLMESIDNSHEDIEKFSEEIENLKMQQATASDTQKKRYQKLIDRKKGKIGDLQERIIKSEALFENKVDTDTQGIDTIQGEDTDSASMQNVDPNGIAAGMFGFMANEPQKTADETVIDFSANSVDEADVQETDNLGNDSVSPFEIDFEPEDSLGLDEVSFQPEEVKNEEENMIDPATNFVDEIGAQGIDDFENIGNSNLLGNGDDWDQLFENQGDVPTNETSMHEENSDSPIVWEDGAVPYLNNPIPGVESYKVEDEAKAEVDYNKLYEEILSERLSYKFGENYMNEINKDENQDIIATIREGAKATVEREKAAAIENEMYKKQLLEKGFEENSKDMDILLGMNRELIQEKTISGEQSERVSELSRMIADEEAKRLAERSKADEPVNDLDDVAEEVIDGSAAQNEILENKDADVVKTEQTDQEVIENDLGSLENPLSENIELQSETNDVIIDDSTAPADEKDFADNVSEAEVDIELPEVEEMDANPEPIIDEYGQVILNSDLKDNDVEDSMLAVDAQPDVVISDTDDKQVPEKQLGEIIYGDNFKNDYDKATPEDREWIDSEIEKDLSYRYSVIHGCPIEMARKIVNCNHCNQNFLDGINSKWEKLAELGVLDDKVKAFKNGEGIFIEPTKDELIESLRKEIAENAKEDNETRERLARAERENEELRNQFARLKELLHSIGILPEDAPSVDAPEQEVGPSLGR